MQYLLSEPEKQLVLAELSRRAQPEGEAQSLRCDPSVGFFVSNESCNCAECKPEGEAPQADVETLLYEHQRAVEGVFEHGETGGFYEALEESRKAIRQALAVPFAAQQAESGAQARRHPRGSFAEFMNPDVDDLADSLAAQSQGAQAAHLPNGWTVERVGDAMHIKRADDKWCGYMPEIGPAAALTFEFLRDIAPIAAKAEAPALDWPHAPGRDGAQDAPPNPAQQAAAPAGDANG